MFNSYNFSTVRLFLIAIFSLLFVVSLLNGENRAQDSPGGYLVIDSNAGTEARGALFRVDPLTGDRTLVSDFGDASQGELGNLPGGIAVEGDGNILVVDSTVGTFSFGALFRVDPVTGNRRIVSDFGNTGQGASGSAPVSVTVGDNGNILVTDLIAGTGFSGTLFRVDPSTGGRTVVSDFGDVSQGELGTIAQDVEVESDGNLVVIDPDAGTGGSGVLFRVDPVTGDRTVVSDFGNIDQGELGNLPGDVAIEGNGNILVLDSGAGTRGRAVLFRVDPVTGERTILSDFGDTGQGELGSFPGGVVVEAEGDILVVDSGGGTGGSGRLFRVDPETGDRTVVSDFGDIGQGDLGFNPNDIAIVPFEDEPLDPDTEIAQCIQLNLQVGTTDISSSSTRVSPDNRRVVYSIGDMIRSQAIRM